MADEQKVVALKLAKGQNASREGQQFAGFPGVFVPGGPAVALATLGLSEAEARAAVKEKNLPLEFTSLARVPVEKLPHPDLSDSNLPGEPVRLLPAATKVQSESEGGPPAPPPPEEPEPEPEPKKKEQS